MLLHLLLLASPLTPNFKYIVCVCVFVFMRWGIGITEKIVLSVLAKVTVFDVTACF